MLAVARERALNVEHRESDRERSGKKGRMSHADRVTATWHASESSALKTVTYVARSTAARALLDALTYHSRASSEGIHREIWEYMREDMTITSTQVSTHTKSATHEVRSATSSMPQPLAGPWQ